MKQPQTPHQDVPADSHRGDDTQQNVRVRSHLKAGDKFAKSEPPTRIPSILSPLFEG